jgi:hypothetical protein
MNEPVLRTVVGEDEDVATASLPRVAKRSSISAGGSLPSLPAHLFPQRASSGEVLRRDWQDDPDIWLYRKKTTALLRRYMLWSLEAGRVPSLLGRELFRAKVTGLTATTFESRVIFLHDIEQCLNRLQGFDRQLIGRVCPQEYDHAAAAKILHCTRRTVERRLPELIDELSEMFLKAQLLTRLPEVKERDGQ